MDSSPPSGTDAGAAAGSVRELLSVAVPLILSSGTLSLMNVIDRVFLTWYSTDAVAAALPSGVLYWTCAGFAIGVASYVNSFVAQYSGAGRPDRVAASIWQGAYFSVAAGAVMLLLNPAAPFIFALTGHAPAVQAYEVQNLAVLCLGGTPLILSTTLACFYSGRGRTLVIFAVNLASVSLNAVLDYCLIFGNGPFPEWGIRGAATATVAGNTLAAAIYVVLLSRPAVNQAYGVWRNRRFDRELFARMMRYGLPNGVMHFVEIGAFSMFVFMIGSLGTAELAATTIAFNLNSLAFIPMMGMGIAVSTLVGTRIGEGRVQLAVRTTWVAFAVSGCYMIAFAAFYLLLPDLLLAPYAMNNGAAEFSAVRRQVVVLLRFVAAFSFFDAMAIVFASAVRGAGDTRYAMVFTIITVWLLLVLPTWLVTQFWGGSLFWSWTFCTVYVIVLGFGFLWRFLEGKWQSMRVIEQFPTPDFTESMLEDSPPAAKTVEAV